MSERARECFEHRVAMIDNRWKVRIVDCPRCDQPQVFFRNSFVCVDACGFLSCLLECGRCNAVLSGVIDPYDEGLLVSSQTTY